MMMMMRRMMKWMKTGSEQSVTISGRDESDERNGRWTRIHLNDDVWRRTGWNKA